MSPFRVIRAIAAVSALVGLVVVLPEAQVEASEPSRIDPLDWPHWRGPEMNMISRETGLSDTWSPDGENLLWKREDLGTRSTPVVMNGKVYLLCRHQPGTKEEQEKVVCVEAATGKTVWEHPFQIFLCDVPDTRVAWSSVVADPESGNVFAMGVCDLFLCLDGETGQLQWQHSLSEEYGALDTFGGRTNFPVVYDDLVIISSIIIGWGEFAKPQHRFIGFDKRNGQPVWYDGTRVLPFDTTYSTPVLTVIDGQSAMVFGSGDGGVHAILARTGKPLWTYEASLRGINTTPVVVPEKNLVICGHMEENVGTTEMGALFALDLKTGKELWKHKEWFVGKSSPLYVDGRIYAADEPGTSGTLLVVDAESGEKIAEQRLRGPMRSSPLFADGKIYCMTENGIWWVLRPTEKGVEEVVPPSRTGAGESHGSPIVSHGRMYIPTSDALYCVGKPDHQVAADPRPPQPKESPVDQDEAPAHVQVVPAESLLRPGQKQEFSIRLCNARGQFLKTATADECQLSITGPGSLTKARVEKAFELSNGAVEREQVNVWKYATPDEAVHAAVLVTAKFGDLVGTARVRVVPPLPWSFDFDSGEVPVTWVSMRYRHIPLDFDVYQKLSAADPLAGKAYIYLLSDFINFERTSTAFDNSTPAQRYTELLEFFGLETAEPDEIRQKIDAALELLKAEQAVSEWAWSTTEQGLTRLSVNRGPRKIDGNGVMCKIATIPKGTRSQGWMGHADLGGYTIQADVLGAERNMQLPDIGLIGQRYVFQIMGASQQMQITTWYPQLRMAETVPFQWKGDSWYTMKLRAAVEDGQTVLRGKVWPRGEAEPKDWMIEATDPIEMPHGSPGFRGDATLAEIFYDNVKVYPNE